MTNRVVNKWLSLFCLLWSLAHTSLAQPAWTVNPAGYQFSMNVVAQVRVGGQPNHAPGNIVAAFHQGAVRGVATPLIINNEAYYFLTLFSNGYVGDSLVFKAFLLIENQLYESSDTVVFQHQKVLGSLASPFPLHFGPSENPFIYSSAEVSFIENSCTDTLLDVQAGDNENSEGDGLAYSLTGGADISKFSLDPQTGILAWLNFTPDFENPADADADNKYEVEVTVTDQSGKMDAQLITVAVLDNLPPVAQCPADQTVGTGDDGAGDCATTVGGTGLGGSTDACAGLSSYVLTGVTSGSGEGNLPDDQLFNLGTTTVTYTVTDGESGGTSAECSFAVTVNDSENPTVVCPANTVRTPGGPDCEYVIVGSEFDAAGADNCSVPTLGNSISSGATLAGIVLQSNTATTIIWTATDGVGRTGSCSFTVTVGNCNVNISGTIKWQTDPDKGVNTTVVALSGSATGSMTTGTNGNFAFSTALASGSFTITPTKNINKLNGVTIADATAVQQHVANTIPITDPYKIVAADVNKSNSVTTLDANIINQALLGNPSGLAQFKTSWRFAPTTHTMVIPPWGFPENIVLANVTGNQTGKYFYGFKTGDIVTPTATPANLGGSDNALVWRLRDQTLEAGAEVVAEFSLGEMGDLAAFQMALRFDPVQLQFVEIQPLAALPLTIDNFGVYNISEGEIRVVWSQPTGIFVSENAPVFRLKFTAVQSGGLLSEALQLDESVLPTYSYNSVLAESKVELKFTEPTGLGDGVVVNGLQLFQNRPNPFSGTTAIGFVLPENCEVQLRVFDVSGRMVAERKAQYPAGRQEEIFNLEGATGVLWYELVTPVGILTKKMVAVE